MALRVELTSELECTADTAWAHVLTAPLLEHISWPLIRFLPLKGQSFPHYWQPGEYRAWMFLFVIIPLGWQAIVITLPPAYGDTRFVRDNGYSPLIKRWDHWIEAAPGEAPGTTRYTDRVTIEAGLITPIIAGFARVFYAHRQRRWRALARSGFAALAP
ncbi:MAG: hypothetical protein AAFQ13_09635 [Pseudomonadota bacterium]